MLFYMMAFGTLITMALLLGARVLPSLCMVNESWCAASHAQLLVKLQPVIAEHFNLLGGVLLACFLVLLVAAKVCAWVSI